jgi:regulator of protease activity HflC (stomatin/prohibitin superfamily)
MKIRTVIAPTERGLMIKDKAIVDILEPGVYWQPPVLGNHIEVISITDARCMNTEVLALVKTNPELAARHFTVVDLSDAQVGIVYQDNKLVDMLAPGSTALYWRGLVETRVDAIDTTAVRDVDDKLARTIGRTGPMAKRAATLDAVLGVDVQQKQIGFLYENGVRVAVLAPGYYLYWKFNRKLKAKVMTTGLTVTEVAGQEILTKDRVSLRLNLSAIYQITDPVQAEDALNDINEYVYRELQLALRRAVGSQTLDQLLIDKAALDAAIAGDVSARLIEVGLTLQSVGVKDVILPGEMKDILNQVVAAEKSAQANNIRRREETAATRSLLNTAKLMADNPVLVRLKELEALEKVSGNIDRITVIGGMEGVMTDLVKLADS